MRLSLNKTLDKRGILSMMQCYEGSKSYDAYSTLYEELITDTILDNLTGYYTIEEDGKGTVYGETIYCIVTLSDDFDRRVNDYFSENDYMSAMLLSTIGDYILFKASRDLYDNLINIYSNSELNLSQKFEPGSQSVEMSEQKTILDKVNLEHETGIDITSGFMYRPQKTLGYYYKASKEYSESVSDHDCSKCDMEECAYRKAIITVGDKCIQVNKGANLLDVLRDNGVDISAYCSGNGSCGKCKVRQIGGKKLEIDDDEQQYLSPQEIKDSYVLACYHRVLWDMEFEVLEDNGSDILSNTDNIDVREERYVYRHVDTIDTELEYSLTQSINNAFGIDYDWSIRAIRELSNIQDIKDLHLLVRDDNEILSLSNERKNVYGFSLDIGTTTIVLSLINLITKEIIGTHKRTNPQGPYGSDVISRINYNTTEKKGRLGKIIREAIELGIHELIKDNNISKEDIYELVIGANTTMQYLLLDIDPYRLAVSPFTCIDINKYRYSWNEVFYNNGYDMMVSIIPSISAYIGGDITSGMLYKDLLNDDGNILFIDIGTNGEVALKLEDKIICVSTAAGPALEGANIECGVSSIIGAINHIDIDNGVLSYETIGGVMPPKGICGTALIDIIACLLDEERLESSGKLDRDRVEIYKGFDNEIYLSQRDIRQYQLAKAAIAAGIEIMINKANLEMEDINKLYLAGGIANHLDVKNAAKTGLIPTELAEKVELIGNSSLSGAQYYLLARGCMDKVKRIKDSCCYIELSMDPDFNNAYIEKMMFEVE